MEFSFDMKEVSSLTEVCDEGMLSVAEKVKLDFYIAKYSKVLKLFFFVHYISCHTFCNKTLAETPHLLFPLRTAVWTLQFC